MVQRGPLGLVVAAWWPAALTLSGFNNPLGSCEATPAPHIASTGPVSRPVTSGQPGTVGPITATTTCTLEVATFFGSWPDPADAASRPRKLVLHRRRQREGTSTRGLCPAMALLETDSGRRCR